MTENNQSQPKTEGFIRPEVVHPIKDSPLTEIVYLRRHMTPEEFVEIICKYIDCLIAENKERREELKQAYGRITALSLKEGRTRIADIFQSQQAEIERLAGMVLRFDNYCRVNDVDIEQVLRRNS